MFFIFTVLFLFSLLLSGYYLFFSIQKSYRKIFLYSFLFLSLQYFAFVFCKINAIQEGRIFVSLFLSGLSIVMAQILFLLFRINIVQGFIILGDKNFVVQGIKKYGIYGLLMIFFICICVVVTLKHNNFFSYGFDLGIFDQVVWQYSQGNFPASSSIRQINNILGDHFHPILMLYSIIYQFYSSPLMLLYLQNFAFVLGGLGIYKIAIYKLKSQWIALGLIVIYLVFQGNITALLFDFHPMVIAVSLLPWLLYFSLREKYILYFLVLFLILISKENMSLYIIFLGIFQLFYLKNKYIGIISIIIGIGYFYCVMNYFIPFFGGNNLSYWSYDAVGVSPGDMIKNLFIQPRLFLDTLFTSEIKWGTYLQHFSSGGYLGMISPAIILLIPAYAQKFLSNREEFWTMDMFHYSIDISWGILIGVIYVLYFFHHKYKGEYAKNIMFFLSIFIILNAIMINIYYSPLLRNNYYYHPKRELLYKYIQQIDSNSSISTQNALIPHLSQRKEIYLFPYIGSADYVFIDYDAFEGWPFETRKQFEDVFKKLLDKKEIQPFVLPFIRGEIHIADKYELINSENGVYLFKKLKN